MGGGDGEGGGGDRRGCWQHNGANDVFQTAPSTTKHSSRVGISKQASGLGGGDSGGLGGDWGWAGCGGGPLMGGCSGGGLGPGGKGGSGGDGGGLGLHHKREVQGGEVGTAT